jgi:hypothetical protein
MMTHRDDYLDAMLRHLGAAYYESVHGRASRSDVTRALDTVAEHLNEHPTRSDVSPKPSRPVAYRAGGSRHNGGPAGSAT